MRTFKIIIITIIFLVLAGLVLIWIKNLISNSVGPESDEFSKIYDEDRLPEGDIYADSIKKLDGVIKVLGTSIYGEGTHRLEKDDKLVVLLESKKVNLSDFEGKEVKVTGPVRDSIGGGQKIMEVRFIEQTKESGVKIFNEVGYDFSFSYPGEWKVKKEKNKVTFFTEKENKDENIMIVYQYPEIGKSFDDWIKDRDQNLFYEEKQVKVGKSNGVRRTVSNGDQKIVKTYTKAGNNAYELRLISQGEVIRNQYFSIVDYFQTSFIDTIEEDKKTDKDSVTKESGKIEKTIDKSSEKIVPKNNLTEESANTEISETSEPLDNKVFSSLSPLSSDEVSRVLKKGYARFDGKTLSFQYPKVWYFSYLGDGIYGFTDDKSYKVNNDEVTLDISRMLIISGTVNVKCVATADTTVETVKYTVCAREPGLEEITSTIVKSIGK